ncbi:AAA family ATPase [Patulibacter brassicae]|uniref:AAA family ATPase n=1 Tax=Patulibacter brassicae TaxID=1705717 RepID=A0ABU4VL56_9ACTN|nr:AAA family ATPase [Patulibacter brassicae]MDX8152414.1 AAA family ATPase [Patulibacter brassicae]
MLVRDEELRLLLDATGEPGGGRPVAVEGVPGIGKTRLLAEAERRLREAGTAVVRGAGGEFERDLPFGVWVDALADALADPRLPLEALGGQETVDALAAVLPPLAARAERHASPLLAERHRLHAAFRALLTGLAAHHGGRLVVLLDDLHWGDDASLDLVAGLLRRPALRTTLVVAARPAQVPERLAAALERAERDARLLRIGLDVLDAAACDQLLGASVPAERRVALREESGGNPFYLLQLARATEEGPVPRTVRDAIAAELRPLAADTRRVLEGGVVAGDPFEPELAAAAAETAPATTAAAIDELVRFGLLRVAADGRRLHVRHPLVRRAVYEGTGAGWRPAAHGRVLALLRDRGAPPALLAHHVARSASPGDRDAVALLVAGAAAVVDQVPASAADWLTSADALLRGADPTAEERLAVLEPLAAARVATRDSEGARAALDEALRIEVPEDEERRRRLVVAAAGVDHRLGRHRDARRRLEEELAAAGDRPAPRAALLVELAADAFYRADPVTMEQRAAEALDAARQAGDAPHELAALGALAWAGLLQDRVDDAREHWDAGDALAATLSDDALAVRLDGLHFLTLAAMYLERFAALIRHAERGMRVARATRQGALLPVLALGRGYATAMLGRLPEARRILDDAVEEARIDGAPLSLAWVEMNAVFADFYAGEIEAGLARLDETLRVAGTVDTNPVLVQLRLVEADLLLQVGNHGRALEAAAAAGAPEFPAIAGFWRCYALDLLCAIELELGHRPAAEAARDRVVAQADRLGLPLARSWARRASARIALADDPAAAATLALEAVELQLQAPGPVEALRTRVLAGRALGRAGERDAALEQLEQAVAEAEAAGTRAFRDDAAREMRRLGRRPVRGVVGAPGLPSLSGREREIAELVADGRTNAEIAGALYLSPKTVESHLRNVFQKLRVSSRLEVARMVDRERDGRD